MTIEKDLQAIRQAVIGYLEGMIYGQPERLRQVMHPKCMQAGHYRNQYEFFPRDEFIASIAGEKKEPKGAQIEFNLPMIDVTGDIAVVKVTDECFGTVWTDYLTLIKHEGEWQITMKAFYDHANDRN